MRTHIWNIISYTAYCPVNGADSLETRASPCYHAEGRVSRGQPHPIPRAGPNVAKIFGTLPSLTRFNPER